MCNPITAKFRWPGLGSEGKVQGKEWKLQAGEGVKGRSMEMSKERKGRSKIMDGPRKESRREKHPGGCFESRGVYCHDADVKIKIYFNTKAIIISMRIFYHDGITEVR